MNKVLLPTDFSENSLNALHYAIKMFEGESCEFDIIHSFNVSTSSLSSTRKKEKNTRVYHLAEEKAKEEMKSLLVKLREEHIGEEHKIRGFTTDETISSSMYKAAKEMKADYVVMGTKGATGAAEIFLGSNTVDVIKALKYTPVLAVPDNYKFKNPEKILFANDFKRNFEPEEVGPLKNIAKLIGAEVVILYLEGSEELSEIQLKNKTELFRLLEGVKVSEIVLKKDFSVAETIQEYLENEKLGMLCMINNHHSFMDGLFREPVVKQVAFHVEVPFLVMPEVE
ncbi:universal stress protein [Robertkochia solimangrovi]|uniref:universal stress protein n=1 Tax=Robertkochia solimangrovi TaxID=2213046 RepID=UPI00117E6823|nr:universal stress protein [Robertkochia solimangrovi]TRZ43262.1 hypothetical protein DMZ48_11280 [Robertkochia solimangrovi]